jgi:predicted DNA-binding WGR domain protein
MLDFWIIEDMLRRERTDDASQREHLELPATQDPREGYEEEVRDDEQERGVVVIDYSV